MFSLQISGPGGAEAEFNVASATLALDLALRSERAGLHWNARLDGDAGIGGLTLRSLRELAVARATGDAERQLIDQIEWQHELQSSFSMN